MKQPYNVTLAKPKPTKLVIRKREQYPRKTVIRYEDGPDPNMMQYAKADWGCEPGTPSYRRQNLALAYASRRLLEEITKTLYARRIERLF